MLTLKDIKEMNVPDDTPIQVNSVWDDTAQELTPSDCDAFYHETDKKIYITPDIISVADDSIDNA